MQETWPYPFPDDTEWTYWHRKETFQLAEDTYDKWVMFAVEAGSFRYRIQRSEGTAEAGDVVVCPPRVRFEREVIEPLSFAFISFNLRTDDVSRLPQGRVRIADAARLHHDLARLKALPLHEAADWGPYGAHYGADIWLQCLEAAGKREETSPPSDAEMDTAVAWLRTHVGAKSALGEAAARGGLTPVQFTRRFQRAYGIAPQQFLLSLRIAEARKLLLTTDWTLDRIALSCGYENGFSLSRSFMRATGMRPSRYREHHRL
ncbi:AraC family transcriptional regulator [Paenibacillus sacheonensis]|uniref:Helix-turn-helix domain-containing protein n=1 Tax=Paenibacillus sacheonensis TaxID=742054 RepID=A0A7X5C2Z4_9BACL|nr:AraC family transcriptional regulator [Paenibacillus sacheonensis]MBM7567195.1 AraC-like DNA-binding protein [Paenibacillus sacheonensis]NBC70879.1 helix-turn-helix domain-containing protein [Paenibacillus sacheonensis]